MLPWGVRALAGARIAFLVGPFLVPSGRLAVGLRVGLLRQLRRGQDHGGPLSSFCFLSPEPHIIPAEKRCQRANCFCGILKKTIAKYFFLI